MVSVDKPYSTGIFETIVGVHFGDGLAVEFTKHGHLQIAAPGFSKGIFAFWFRIPQSTVDGMRHVLGAVTGPFDNIIPLVVFGSVQKEVIYDTVEIDTTISAGVPHPTQPIIQFIAANPQPGLYIPSYIGVYCDPFTRKLSLTVQIQMADYANLTGLGTFAPVIEDWSNFDPNNPSVFPAVTGDGIFSEIFHTWAVHGIQDVSNEDPTRPEYFSITQMPSNLTTDHWHMVIISPDLSPPCNTHGSINGFSVEEGTTSSCKIWIAVDDINYNGDNLGPYNVSSANGINPNGILTPNAVDAATGIRFLALDNYVGPPTCHYQPKPIPSGPLGIPVTGLFSSNGPVVEMGEFQFWRGQTMATNIDRQRRLFLDVNGKPVPPKTAEKVLGKPAILLHGSSNWIHGKNTGSIRAGFAPTPVIKRYVPDPSLHGPQSPADLKKK